MCFKKSQSLLKREAKLDVSVAMVGRIISKGIKIGRIKSVSALIGRPYHKKKRGFHKHAKRWQYGMKAAHPRELVQIDHMSVQYPGSSLKHFKAICPKTRWMVAHVFRSASSKNAAAFLEQVITQMPFKIRSIQVDGGSEFMKHFEEACQKKAIGLFVLPPRHPQYNGTVERCNGSTRTEFYEFYDDTYDPSTVNRHLRAYQDRFNTYRPHQSLHYLTPMAYYQSSYQNNTSQSQLI